MKKNINLFLLFLSLFFLNALCAQAVILDANGAGNTYEDITAVLAPGHNPVEVPDCGHSAFGRHIDEVFDATLNDNVFRFYMHTGEDDDRCINFDRQRNEIKSYNQSPDNLLGVENEVVQYKWKFKLANGFQSSSSFTHLHQLKAVGGTESSMPLITFTARKATPNDKLQLRYAQSTTQTTIHEADLTPFFGEWVEVNEIVTYGELGTGTYSVGIKKVSDNSTLFTYSNSNIRMWKTDADFIRPKWGIYRSLNVPSDLRDEEVLFADFSIEENPSLSVDSYDLYEMSLSPNPVQEVLEVKSPVQPIESAVLYDIKGKKLNEYFYDYNSNIILDLSYLESGIYIVQFKTSNEIVVKKVVKM